MPMFDGSVGGFDEFHAALQDLPVQVDNKILQKAILASGNVVITELEAAAPYDSSGRRSPSSERYGHLKENIIEFRLKRNPTGQRGARISTGNAFWGYFREKGTRYEPAVPWFLPATKRAYQAWVASLGENLQKSLTKQLALYAARIKRK